MDKLNWRRFASATDVQPSKRHKPKVDNRKRVTMSAHCKKGKHYGCFAQRCVCECHERLAGRDETR